LRLVFEALRAGRSLNSIAGKKGDVRIPSLKIVGHDQLAAFRNHHAQISSLIGKLAAANLKNQIHRVRTSQFHSGIRHNNEISASIRNALPSRLTKEQRDEISQMIWFAIGEGRLRPRDVAGRMQEFVRLDFRLHHNKFGPRSLDMPLHEDGHETLIDTITRGLWD
jgi:hypothetical protein